MTDFDFFFSKATHFQDSNIYHGICIVENKEGDKMSEWIKLNVGGQTFYTTRTTLMSEPESMLARMFSEENKNILMPCQMENDTYLIDRFVQILSPDI